MYYMSERNERRSRQLAFWLALGFHLALGALLYLQTGKPSSAGVGPTATVQAEKAQPSAAAKPKRVTTP